MSGSVLAVDLGKTRCRVALWHGGVHRDADGPGAPGLAGANGVAHAEAAILPLTAGLLRASGLARVDAAGVGVAGALAAPDAAGLLARRLCTSLPATEVSVASDAVTSHAGALGGQPGVVLAAGTGAVAVAVGPDKVLHRIDGLGPWLGDDGGGGSIGLAGLRAAAQAADGRGPATLLLAAAERQFGPVDGFAALLAGDPNPARIAAGFAPAVADAAASGDAVATTLIAAAARALATTVRAAASRLPGQHIWPFAVVGGLVSLGDVLLAPLHAALADAPLAAVAAPGSALDGARLLTTPAATLYDGAVHRAAASAGKAPDSLDTLATEAVRPGLEDLDQRTPGAVVRLALEHERAAQDALLAAAPSLAALADAVADRMRRGGRLFYLGAGTSGRLATLDAAELSPTYSAPPGLVVALLAGGPRAMAQAVEGAEDDAGAAAAALDAHGLSAADAVVGIAASGRTPFVTGGLRHARDHGALTGAIVNNPASPVAAAAEFAVEILTGPEIVAGSTRMAAGTTQKIALNALSTACMVALGRTFGSRMVDLRASNAKLRRRALRTLCEVTGCTEDAAANALAASGGRVKPALVMLLAELDAATAERRLDAAGGHVRRAILPEAATE